jgi:hypothetical protein
MIIIVTRNKDFELTKQCSHVEDTYIGSKKCVECKHCIKANYGFCDWKSFDNERTCSAIYDIKNIECKYDGMTK